MEVTLEFLIIFIAMTGNFLFLLFEISRLKVMLAMQSSAISVLMKYNPELFDNMVKGMREDKENMAKADNVVKEMNELWNERKKSMNPAKSK
jgi:hypothetical protein